MGRRVKSSGEPYHSETFFRKLIKDLHKSKGEYMTYTEAKELAEKKLQEENMYVLIL